MTIKLILWFAPLCCVLTAAASGAEPAKEITIDLGGEKLEMVLIPAGSFTIGDVRGERDENPVHKVNITRPFYLAKYELTQRQWVAVMGGIAPGSVRDPAHPVSGINHMSCVAFLKTLNEKLGGKQAVNRDQGAAGHVGTYRLPTEAEWEYACRAGSNTRYSFGDDAKQLSDYAWYYENSEGSAQPVGRKKPNAWGLYDMHGNVWEYCRDPYLSDYYTTAPADDDPVTFQELNGSTPVIRGGGWDYSAKSCRSADRGFLSFHGGSDNLGFRVSRSVEEK